MNFLKSLKSTDRRNNQQDQAPPQWAAATETSHIRGKFAEAPVDEYEAAINFCNSNAVHAPRLLPITAVDAVTKKKCLAWGIEVPETSRFSGRVYREPNGGSVIVETDSNCQDVCLLSDLPIMAGLYEIRKKEGAYYEITIRRMEGIIAVGTACRPYPSWRLPGWNRLSAGLHLDDFRKFFENPDGGMDYQGISCISPGDTVGVGYEYGTASLFFTYNGVRLSNAFSGIYFPREHFDVFAAIGVEGANQFHVNFGGDIFLWKEANEWRWTPDGHVGGSLGSGVAGGAAEEEELPGYSRTAQ